jgi:phage baseplate assembly protein W
MLELFGLVRPFQRDGKSDFTAAGSERLIRSAVGQILGTVGGSDFTQGELLWNTSFGSLLHLLRNRKNDAALQELARLYVVDALKRWEPRVQVTSVQLSRERDQGKNILAIRLRYNILPSAGDSVVISHVEQVVKM